MAGSWSTIRHAGGVTWLTEIIDAASGDSSTVPTLLRKLKVLAARTETGRLAEWVRHELEGYPDASNLPSYRGPFDTMVLGHFVGSFNTEAKNVPIPPMTFPEDMRAGALFTLRLGHSIAEIEDMAAHKTTQLAWPADAVAYYNYGAEHGHIHRVVRADMALVQAIRPISRQVFVGVLDAVRTRALDLALELEQVAPDAGEPEAPSSTRDQARQVVNTYNFYGGTSNVAIGSSQVTQTVELPKPGDEDALLRYLGAAGVQPGDLVQLQEALVADRDETGGINPPQPGSRVRAWMARAATGVTTGVASGVIVAAIKAFFGV